MTDLMVQLLVLKQCHRATKLKEGDYYTYSIVDLTNNLTNVTIQITIHVLTRDLMLQQILLLNWLIKNTGNVVETRTVSASSGIQKFTTTKASLIWGVNLASRLR